MPTTPKEMVRLLKKHGFHEVSQNGSHLKMFNPQTETTTIVPMHSKDLGKGIEHKILSQSGIKQRKEN